MRIMCQTLPACSGCGLHSSVLCILQGSFPRDPDLLIIVATDAVETEALAVVSFFEKSVCKNFLCRLLHFGLQLLLLQCFDR